VQEFGPDYGRFTVDVPDGWTVTKNDHGALFVDKNKTCSVAIAVSKTQGAYAKTLCKGIAQQSGMKEIKSEEANGSDSYMVAGEINGAATIVTVSTEGDKFVCFTVSGDMDAASPLIDSLADK